VNPAAPTPPERSTAARLHAYAPTLALWALVASCVSAACYERGDRWLSPPKSEVDVRCTLGDERCNEDLERCEEGSDGPRWVKLEDCASQGLVCSPKLTRCALCDPGARQCDGQTILTCDASGEGFNQGDTCDVDANQACRRGTCVHLCEEARDQRSNVGCEYWAVDLDNANVGGGLNAAEQQFAVVVSNAQPDLPAQVTIEQDDTSPGDDNDPLVVTRATVPPFSLTVFKLGPREVDGSPPGEYNTGTHTALTRGGYRIKTSVPVVAYQFNPLENVNVFSNDASLLKPVEALGDTPGLMRDSYVVLGWPQTIASTDDPDTNFDPNNPSDLRAFLTIVGTRANTRVQVIPSTFVLGGGPVDDTDPGETIEVELQPFDVLNLETDDFNADFTGSLIRADQAIVVFSGSEASDAPWFDSLDQRQCCADHLEEQLDPIRTAGKFFVASISPNRTAALALAGASVGVENQVEYFRAIAATEGGARLSVTVPGTGVQTVTLPARGDSIEIVSPTHFVIESDNPIMLGSVSPSQGDARVPRGLPGGDPSFMIVPPVEQFRASYVFLTPDKYVFDFIRIIAPPDTEMQFDGRPLDEALDCDRQPGDSLSEAERGASEPAFWVYSCQLSFPIVDTSLDAEVVVLDGTQNDGVHRLEATRPVGLLVDGFDSFVSYAYAGGTELTQIVPE
jgi:hypothetical protein